jgi:YD repeat-containing protein
MDPLLTHDAQDQLTGVTYKTGGAVERIVSYFYDAAGNRTNMIRSGMGFQPVRSESYSYDPADQLTGVTYATGSTTDRIVSYLYDAAGNRTNMLEILGTATNTTVYTADADNQLTSATADRQGITVTGYVEPGSRSNKWYASTAAARGQSAAVSSQNGTFAIPGVPVTGGANALTVTVTDVSGNIATQVVNVTVISGQPVSIGYDAKKRPGVRSNYSIIGLTVGRDASAAIGPGGGRQPAEPGKRDRA